MPRIHRETSDELPMGIALFQLIEKIWHQGVLGIVASRIKESINIIDPLLLLNQATRSNKAF